MRHLVIIGALIPSVTISRLFQLVVQRGEDGFGFTVAGGRPAHIYTVEPGESSEGPRCANLY